MTVDTSKSVQHNLERALLASQANTDDPTFSVNDLEVVGAATVAETLAVTGNTSLTASLINTRTNGATVKGIYYSGTIVVGVPTVADAEADEVAVDVSSLTFAPAVGDAVIAIPLEALPTSALLNGAYVSATDTVKVSFGTLEGGAGITGANKNFGFLFFDLT